jgi:5-methylcytosine-specific restriction endonuclease McrA
MRSAKWRIQRGRCFWCGKPMRPFDSPDPDLRASADHLRPRSIGGRTTWRNIVLAHQRCNAERTRHEAYDDAVSGRLA